MNYDVNTAEGTNMAFILDVIFDAAFTFDKVQSDWNQDSPLEMDFIKNKPSFVPYEGASRNLDLGTHSLETTSVIYKETPPETKEPLQRYYDPKSNTTKFVRLDGGETNDNQELGGEFTNVDSIELLEKTLVSAVPLAGNRKGMARLDISSKTSVENFLGMITVPSIPINGKGLVTFTGEVDASTSGLLENAQIYAGVTPGSWSITPPPKGYYTVIVGTVVVSANNGKVFLNPRVLPKLNDLSDVTNNATEGQPLTKQEDGTWAGSDTIKINKTQPDSGIHTVEGNQTVTGNQTVQGSQSSASVSTGNITSTGKVEAKDVESIQGFKKPGATNEDFLLGAGGTKSFATLKQGIYQLFKPDGSQAIVEINAAGDVLISGNILINGQAYEVEAEKISTSEELIELRRGATTGLPLGALAGFIIKLYDGVNDGMLAIDRDGIMRIGDVGDLQPVLTREESPVDQSPMFWNDTTKRAETLVGTTSKTSLVDNDAIMVKDSADSYKPKWWTFSNIKANLKNYFDTLFVQLANVNQTIEGTKTFSSLPKIPLTPLANEDAASKAYADGQANVALTAANAARDKAQQWAEKEEDSPVEEGKYSAKHYALKALSAYAELPNVEHALADIIAHLLGRIQTLEELLTASAYNTIQVNELSVVENIKLKGAYKQLFGTGAPTVTPDFAGQEYLNQTAKIWYDAVGTANAGDWKPRTNV